MKQTGKQLTYSRQALTAIFVLSILLHGLSVNPGIQLYMQQLADRRMDVPEQAEIGKFLASFSELTIKTGQGGLIEPLKERELEILYLIEGKLSD